MPETASLLIRGPRKGDRGWLAEDTPGAEEGYTVDAATRKGDKIVDFAPRRMTCEFAVFPPAAAREGGQNGQDCHPTFALDTYVKAQTSAPEVVKRITELENCLQHLANAVSAFFNLDKHEELRTAVEQAKLALKNRLEVDESKHRFRSELEKIKE